MSGGSWTLGGGFVVPEPDVELIGCNPVESAWKKIARLLLKLLLLSDQA